ncbi:MAG: hypothetical protein GWN29_02485, partial [Gammaproteobacteria bacterium]|nr:hypothetical protein [Gammaproteobacteria bacterium]
SFLSHVKGALALTNVFVEHGRVEDLRDTAPFDTVLARAVAPLPELVELTAHLLGEHSVLLVPTKADVDVTTSRIDDRFAIRRIERDVHESLKGALIAIERRSS